MPSGMSKKTDRLELNGLLACANAVNLLGENIHIIKKHIDALLHARKEIHLQVNAKNQMHVHVLSPQTGTKYIKATNEYMKKCKNSNIWETSKKSELHTHGNSEQTKFQECLLPCTSESLIFLCAI
jgi:hypothetical protein